MLDQTDLAILDLLKKNARLTWKEVGQRVHLTGQAVAGRIARLQELGVLKGFTVQVDGEKLGQPVLAFITVFMQSADHLSFRSFLTREPEVEEAFRISGDGCYWLRVRCSTQQELTAFLDRVLAFGNYSVNLNLDRVK
ncbi:MAG TPA: Lrp/AsnC family transcriptional regulator [Symbiobacteriaceae bacterium]|jgi:Lrp/AsnC family leucine-responsive transcriptional regulator